MAEELGIELAIEGEVPAKGIGSLRDAVEVGAPLVRVPLAFRPTNDGPHELNAIPVGCPSVVIGPTPRPVVGWCSNGSESPPLPDGHQFSWRRSPTEPCARKKVLGLVLDGPRARAQLVARMVPLSAEATGEDDRR